MSHPTTTLRVAVPLHAAGSATDRLSTPQEALQNAYDAIAGWIEAAQEMDRAIPAPQPVTVN